MLVQYFAALLILAAIVTALVAAFNGSENELRGKVTSVTKRLSRKAGAGAMGMVAAAIVLAEIAIVLAIAVPIGAVAIVATGGLAVMVGLWHIGRFAHSMRRRWVTKTQVQTA